ncbi:MAG: hypothetical protein KDE09_16875 [Anaerolineales bacterium]|nr:hypothetical protein [Anaerolineales bacterium]MCB8963319.1 hypothetical protein [Ardenticatenales bacterium]MCB0007691.1 hypothetical protein [Anaerolineales bacterium]MCB0011459.1 hypothetical protein [Anaerolineales bacterium]MCB0019468.1 hypothetical protein [Anaerolineales bacterium]
MGSKKPASAQRKKASQYNETGLRHLAAWELEEAIIAFADAVAADDTDPDYHMNLARGYARSGRFDQAIEALGSYLHVEEDEQIAGRFEQLFSSALDPVEESLIAGLRELKCPMQLIGKTIQMWLEFRITLGRQPLKLSRPEVWSAALTFAIFKVNMLETSRQEIEAHYGVTERALKEKYDIIIKTLDLMPGDYRYFVGDENPLDKLVDAAHELDEIYKQFHNGS